MAASGTGGAATPITLSLLCDENWPVVDKDDDEEYQVKEYISNINPEADDRDDEEFLQILLEKEIKLQNYPIQNRVRAGRKAGIKWIINTRPLFEFRFHTAYLSVTYIDRYLSKKLIQDHKKFLLLSLACLLLAAKIQESDLCVKLSELHNIGGYELKAKDIKRMELDVLSTLEWKMNSITPFDFIRYFVSKCCKERPKREVVVATIKTIFSTIKDRDFMGYLPSVKAIAATLLAMDHTLTRQSLQIRLNEFSLIQSFDIDDVYSCYERILQIQPTTSSDESSSFQQPSATTSGRRRLTFPNDDQQNQEKR